MINLRYHIVSITAVFLALAIGLALGSTLIQRGIVDTLETRLDELGERLDRTDGENSALREVLEQRDEADQRLVEARLPLLGGHLDDRAVLLLAVQGTDDALLSEARRSLRAAGAFVSGTLVLTARWERLTPEEVAELSLLFDRQLDSEEAARDLALRLLADELLAAAEAPPEPPEEEPGLDGAVEGQEGSTPAGTEVPVPAGQDPPTPGQAEGPTAEAGEQGQSPGGETGDQTGDEPGGEVVEPAVPQAEVIESLVMLGYLEFFPESSGVALPRYDTRYVLVADDAAVPEETVAVPLLRAMAPRAGTVAPVVVAGALGPGPDPGDVDDGSDPLDRLAELVRLIRADDRLLVRVTTVDSLPSLEGHAALVLAVAHLDRGVVGHYGSGVGAEGPWPVPAS